MTSLHARWVSAALFLVGCTEKEDVKKAPVEAPADADADDATPLPAVAGSLSAPVATGRPPKESKRRPKSILLAEARELIQWRVADGFLTRDEILERAMESADGRASLRAELLQIVDEELLAHKKRELEWRFATDPDRLARAFAGLERQGILARERYADCRKCGVADIRLEREDLLEKGQRIVGYVFFTDQDVDGISDSGELVLEYGSFRDDDDATKAIGTRIAELLRKDGFSVVDENDGEEAYLVLTDLNWQKRRFTKPPR
jgi:hypothetical protein